MLVIQSFLDEFFGGLRGVGVVYVREEKDINHLM